MHGKPRHSQSQGSVERANQDIRNMLVASMKTTQSVAWAEKLWEIQFCKNRAFHAGIKRSPYEAIFGTKAKVGLTSSSLPDEILGRIESEEDLEEALRDFSNSETPEPPIHTLTTISTSIVTTTPTEPDAADDNSASLTELLVSYHYFLDYAVSPTLMQALCFSLWRPQVA